MSQQQVVCDLGRVLVLLFVLAGCIDDKPDTIVPRTDSETHWLSPCEMDDDCSDGTSCLCGICVDPCTDATCEVAGAEAICVGIQSVADMCTMPNQLVCVPECTTAADCPQDGPPVACTLGACLPIPSDPPNNEECSTDAECAGDDFCRRQACADTTGVCSPRPSTCSPVVAPTCGCDGTPYLNSCAAEALGNNVDARNLCLRECTDASTCASDEICVREVAACGGPSGTCVQSDFICEPGEPVCGCDGQDYSDACVALRDGHNISQDAACDAPACGGFLGTPCAEGFFCDHTENCFEIADGAGVCRAMPDVCNEVFLPVCGCDGQSYGSECDANLAGTDLAHTGACN